MRNAEHSNTDTSTQKLLAWIEIGLGVSLFVWSMLISLFSNSYPALKPDFLYGLSPLIMMFTGPLLMGAGGGILKIKRWPYAMHIPLVLWLLIILLAWY